MTHPKLVESMLNPDFYPDKPGGRVELVQTHISYVFIAGDLVYKVKKPVNFGFLDFMTLEKRKYYCEEELRLNRRLAPDAYLAVMPICEEPSGRLRLGGKDRIVEYAVKMIRLPQDRMLKVLLSQGKAGLPEIEAIARKVAEFHALAATGGKIDEMGSIETIRFNCEENFEQTKKYVGATLSAEKYAFIGDYVRTFIEKERPLFESRISGHRIRDCHGDLHLEHICLTDGIVIFDCIEFNERFRYSDTASEVAFLSMDLDFNGYPDDARAFADDYIRFSKDGQMQSLLNFYRCYRAYVRGKVISFRLDEAALSESERSEIVAAGSRYFDLAFSYAARLEKPALILMTGLMGSGKSHLARNLSPLLGADVLRTDVLRKEMLDISPEERRFEEFGAGIYSDKVSARTYDLALEKALDLISRGRSVILDASFKRRTEREKARTGRRADRGRFLRNRKRLPRKRNQAPAGQARPGEP